MIDYAQIDDVAVLTMDDGKANAVSHALVDAINSALDRAEREAKAVLIQGREGVFSAGFDLKEFKKGPEATAALVHKGATMLLRLFLHPQPVVAASPGHAIAAGAFILLAADTRLGADGDFKIGLNETAIGFELPVFGLELAKARLSKRYLQAAVVQAQLYSPHDARAVGYLDEVCPVGKVNERALELAKSLSELPSTAYAANKRAVRQDVGNTIQASLSV